MAPLYTGKSQHVFHDLSQEELAQTHRWLENLHQRLQFEMVLEGQAESIMDFSQVSRDTIDTDISKLVEIKHQLERQIQQFNQLMEPEVTPSGKSQAGAADRDHDELYPNNSFENIIPMICNKMNQEYEEDCNMDCSNVFPHGNDIYVVMPRQQPMEGMLEHLRQLKQAKETPANKKLLCMTMEQKSKPEYGLAQLEMQVTATKVEPGKKTPLENKNKRQLKSHGPVFIMDKRQQVPKSETQKEKQTRPHLTPLKGRTTKPKTKTQR